jgi:3-methylcrotonyl-CoA carboxylase alpha subunit
MSRLQWKDGDRVREVDVARAAEGAWRVTIDGAAMTLRAEPAGPGRLRLVADSGAVVADVTATGERRDVQLASPTSAATFVLERTTARTRGGRAAGAGLEAPMPGVVTRVMVAVGDAVEAGQPLVALEARKMEHVVRAPHAGTVRHVAARAGEMGSGGIALVELEPAPAD